MKLLKAVKHLSLMAPIALTLLFTGERLAFGQAVESDMQALRFSLPPAKGYVKTFDMSIWGRFLFSPSNYATPDSPPSSDPRQFAYAKVLAPRGAVLSFSGIWDHTKTPIPAATANSDACPHSHAAYGVYARQNFGFFKTFTYLGGGGKYGRRVGSVCSVTATKSNPPVAPGDTIFRWGTNEFIRTVSTFDEYFVMAGQATTHGWGNCGGFQCYPTFTFIMVR